MTVILSITDLCVDFRVKYRILRAVDHVSFELKKGETIGLVGESGCGKSTLGKALIRIIDPTAGSIRMNGTEISTLHQRELRPLRRHIQMIFQDPYGSLNARKKIGQILREPLDVQNVGTPPERVKRVRSLTEKVGLGPDALERFPHEFSGGQRQRIGIARALILEPDILICDEPVSALDVSIQAQVLNLLKDLQQELGLSMIFISHDLAVVRYVADRIAVMYRGRIVEMAARAELWRNPRHPFTRKLIASVLVPDPQRVRRVKVSERESSDTDQFNAPACVYAARCAHSTTRCQTDSPQLRDVGEAHGVACHEHEHLDSLVDASLPRTGGAVG